MRRIPCGRTTECLPRGTVDVARNHLTVPMREFGDFGVVVNVDDHAFAFLEPEQGPGKLLVIKCGRDVVTGPKVDTTRGNPEAIVRRRRRCALSHGPGQWTQARYSSETSESQEVTAVKLRWL